MGLGYVWQKGETWEREWERERSYASFRLVKGYWASNDSNAISDYTQGSSRLVNVNGKILIVINLQQCILSVGVFEVSIPSRLLNQCERVKNIRSHRKNMMKRRRREDEVR